MEGQNFEWMTLSEAATYLRVSPAFLNKDRVYKRHGIPFSRIGSRIRYKKSELDAYLLRSTETAQ